jgi:hypothetical protein
MSSRETGEKKIRRTAYFLDTLFEFDILGANSFCPSFTKPKQNGVGLQ